MKSQIRASGDKSPSQGPNISSPKQKGRRIYVTTTIGSRPRSRATGTPRPKCRYIQAKRVGCKPLIWPNSQWKPLAQSGCVPSHEVVIVTWSTQRPTTAEPKWNGNQHENKALASQALIAKDNAQIHTWMSVGGK